MAAEVTVVSADEADDSESVDSGATKAKKRKGGRYGGVQKSAVWEHFAYDCSKDASQCRHCNRSVAGKHPGKYSF